MPRTLSEAERQLVLRCIMDAQHILVVRNGGTFVERGVAPADADASTSSVMDDTGLLTHLDLALAVLGWKPGDPMPPGTIEQLQAALRVRC